MTEQSVYPHLSLPLGQVVCDKDNRRWVYYGYEILTTGTKMLLFIAERDRRHRRGVPHWTYSAADYATLDKKFPGIGDFIE